MALTGYIINEHGKQCEYDKVKTAIERIQFAYEVSQAQGKGALYVAFSGGKDSVVLAEFWRSCVDYQACRMSCIII